MLRTVGVEVITKNRSAVSQMINIANDRELDRFFFLRNWNTEVRGISWIGSVAELGVSIVQHSSYDIYYNYLDLLQMFSCRYKLIVKERN